MLSMGPLTYATVTSPLISAVVIVTTVGASSSSFHTTDQLVALACTARHS